MAETACPECHDDTTACSVLTNASLRTTRFPFHCDLARILSYRRPDWFLDDHPLGDGRDAPVTFVTQAPPQPPHDAPPAPGNQIAGCEQDKESVEQPEIRHSRAPGEEAGGGGEPVVRDERSSIRTVRIRRGPRALSDRECSAASTTVHWVVSRRFPISVPSTCLCSTRERRLAGSNGDAPAMP